MRSIASTPTQGTITDELKNSARNFNQVAQWLRVVLLDRSGDR